MLHAEGVHHLVEDGGAGGREAHRAEVEPVLVHAPDRAAVLTHARVATGAALNIKRQMLFELTPICGY